MFADGRSWMQEAGPLMFADGRSWDRELWFGFWICGLLMSVYQCP
jgi:hypothetical protein